MFLKYTASIARRLEQRGAEHDGIVLVDWFQREVVSGPIADGFLLCLARREVCLTEKIGPKLRYVACMGIRSLGWVFPFYFFFWGARPSSLIASDHPVPALVHSVDEP